MRHAHRLGVTMFLVAAAVTTLLALRTAYRAAVIVIPSPTPAPSLPPAPSAAEHSLPLSEHVLVVAPEGIMLDGELFSTVERFRSWDSPHLEADVLHELLLALPTPHETLLVIRRGPTMPDEAALMGLVTSSASGAGYLPFVLTDPLAIELDLEADTLRCNGVQIDAAHLVPHLDSIRATATDHLPLVVLHAEPSDPRITAYRIALHLAGYIHIVLPSSPSAGRPQHVLTIGYSGDPDANGIRFDGEYDSAYSMFGQSFTCRSLGGCVAMPGVRGILPIAPLEGIDRDHPAWMARIAHDVRRAGFIPQVVQPANMPRFVVTDTGFEPHERITTPYVSLHVETKKREPLVQALLEIEDAHALPLIDYAPDVDPRAPSMFHVESWGSTFSYSDKTHVSLEEFRRDLEGSRAYYNGVYVDIHDRDGDPAQREKLAEMIRRSGYVPRILRD